MDIVNKLFGGNKNTRHMPNELTEAAREGDYKKVNLLIIDGADVNAKNKYGSTALRVAAWERHLDIVKLLIEKGADVNTRHEDGTTVLMPLTGYFGYPRPEVLRLLVENGADVNAEDNNGNTALHYAMCAENHEIVCYLITKGANVRSCDTNKLSELMIRTAGYFGHLDAVKLFIEYGADVNAINRGGWTALMEAVHHGHIEIVKLLIEKGSKVNAKDRDGSTALMEATSVYIETAKLEPNDKIRISGQVFNRDDLLKRHLEIIKLLIQKGADVNVIDGRGRTILTFAAEEYEHLKITDKYGVLSVISKLFDILNMTEKKSLERIANERVIDNIDFSSLIKKSIIISPNMKRLAYIAQKSNKRFVVVDGRHEKQYDNIREDSLIFSPDGKHMAYIAQVSNKSFVLIDGNEGKQYDDIWSLNQLYKPHIMGGTLIFSPDGKHVAYAAKEGNKRFVVVDEKEEKHYDWVSNLIFSHDSNCLAYSAMVGKESFVVVNGKEEEKRYVGIGFDTLMFSLDDQHLLYTANTGEKDLVVFDGREGEQYDGIIKNSLSISSNGKRIAFAVGVRIKHPSNIAYSIPSNSSDLEQYVVIDWREERKQYRSISMGPIFSPDSTRVAYMARDNNKVFVVIDGKEGKRYDNIGDETLIFSPDSRQIVYMAILGEKSFVVKNGEEEEQFDGILTRPIFSPDSKHVVYAAMISGKAFVVIDGKQEKQYDGLSARPIFSPDSKHVAYGAMIENNCVAVIDGEEGKQYYSIFTIGGEGIFFESSDTLHYLAQERDKIYLVKESIK